MFFMITDPQTAAKGRVARVIYGASVAFIAALLVAPQRTEFSTKVAILAALVVVCALQPLAQRLLPSPGTGEDRLRSWIKARFAHMTPRAAVAPVRLLVPSAASLVLLTGCAGLLVAAAVPAREPSNTTTSAAPSSAHIPARPAIALDPAAVPPVDVTPAVRSADSSMTDSKAREMVRDLVEDLMIESLAVQKLDANVAASAAAGSSLQTTVRAVQHARLTGRRTVAQYHPSRATLILSRDPNDYQASPQVAVQLKGTMLNVAYSGASGLQPSGQNQSALDRIFVLQKAGAHYLIVSDYPPQ
jgi:hypothetical protein